MKVILASSSPRRKELLDQLGWKPDVFPVSFAEVKTPAEAERDLHAAMPAATLRQLSATLTKPCLFSGDDFALLNQYRGTDLVPAYNALGKAKAAADLNKGEERPIIGADTIVVAGNVILGKPEGTAGAKEMLQELSGKEHQVKTAVAVLYRGKTQLQVVTTSVCFRQLTEEEIAWYVATGEPMDKAGAYGIQGKGTFLVESITGNYDNVVGLPLTALYEIMQKLTQRSVIV